MQELALSWIAGVIDADGMLSVSVRQRETSRWDFDVYPFVTVLGSGDDRHDVFRQLADETGNLTRHVDYIDSGGTRRSEVRGQPAAALLEELRPHLRKKQAIADRILEENWKVPDRGRSERHYRSLIDCREDVIRMNEQPGGRNYERDELMPDFSLRQQSLDSFG